MKKTHIITLAFITVCSCITLTSFVVKTTGMHASSTGAPGELGTCADATIGCHSNATVTKNDILINKLTFSAGDSSYVPGQTYTLTIQAKKAGIVKMGFGIVALTTVGDSNAGSWTITDANSTQIITGSGNLASRSYVTHVSGGTTVPYVNPGLGKWTFAWQAPATAVGNIKFYYCTNCTNNNGANTGDALYLSSFQIHPKSNTAVAEWLTGSDFQALLNPASNELILNYQLMKDCELAVSIMDAQGKMIKNISPYTNPAGKYSEHIGLAQDISTGIYFVNLNINNQMISKKIMIQ
jgi:Secretion system C-terminal sorting domain/Reeler domain